MTSKLGFKENVDAPVMRHNFDVLPLYYVSFMIYLTFQSLHLLSAKKQNLLTNTFLTNTNQSTFSRHNK